MKTLAALALSLFLVSRPAVADSPEDADPQPAKSAPPAKSKPAAKKTEKTDANFAAELEELRQALQAQQEQLQMLKEELGKRDRQIDEAREAAAAANARASEASIKATEAVNTSAEGKSSETALSTSVNDLRSSNEVIATTVATAQADTKKAEESGPASIKFKGIALTPGGFVAAETVTRTHAQSSDINTPFNSLPYPGNALTHVGETNMTGRQSRLSLLAEGTYDQVKLTGYYEMDWLGTGVTSNNRQSNSYVNRMRQIWGQAKLASGWSFTGGQMWSLATENRKGIDNRGEAIPLTIDSQYSVGFTWARQYGFRVVKDFGGKFALSVAVEAPQATVGGRGFSSVTTINSGAAPAVVVASGVTTSSTGNTFSDAPGSGGGLLNFSDPTGYAVNKAPDFIIKAAADPGVGHYEVLGIVSVFRNRFYPCGVVGTNATDTAPPAVPTSVPCPVNGLFTVSGIGAGNDTVVGGGIGASARWNILAKKLDFGVKAVGGDGIGRYGSAQMPDLTYRPDGTQALIRSGHALGILEYHPNNKFDFYAYYGAEYAWRAAYQGYNIITVTRTAAIPATATSPAIPATTATTIRLNQIGGYGSPFANNTGCSTENPPINQLNPSGGGACAGDTRLIWEGTLGFWHKIYQGPKGGLRWGIQYSYFNRSAWSGNNSTAVSLTPKAVDSMIWTSLRYYIP